MSSQSGNCSNESFPTIKYCSGTGEYSLVGEGNYKISTLSGNISCFGDVTSSDYIKTTFGPFCCQGNDTFNLNGTGFLYNVMSYFDNCSSLLDNTPYVSYDSHTTMLCNGTGANAFVGNGDFKIKVNGISSNIDLKCDGSVSHIYYTDNGALYTELNVHSYGQFRCIASGYVSINGTGVIEDNELFCVTGLVNTEELLQCSGTGQFEIIASGFFDILAIPEIMCTGTGKPPSFDMGEKFMSGGSFVCNGSESFTLSGTGEIESVTTVFGNHNCTEKMAPIIGSGLTDTVTCSGEGDYAIVGDGDFYINRTGPGMLQCSGEVTPGINTSKGAEYLTTGSFNCAAIGNIYFTGIGKAEVINASASYTCNGDFFRGQTVDPPFSGFGTDEIACFAYGQYVVLGNGHIQLTVQSPTPLNYQGAVISDSDKNTAASTGDFMCTGNDFVQIAGRGEVFVNSTGFNNCTHHDTAISNSLLLCSGFGEYEIFGFANATIFASDELVCNGKIFPLTSSGPGLLYYAGGYYNCTGNGFFNISGVGNATVLVANAPAADITSGYNCLGPQLLTCAMFTFGDNVNKNVTVRGDGEFTIIGDEELYCTGDVVLCPGEINYYFTDGHFYCSSNVFAYINGTGIIENIACVNNCSGIGFGIPPIISGTPLTPQPSCIGFGDQYQIYGSGTFNASRLLGGLDCNITLQEADSDVYIFSSYRESFNCNGRGIFVFNGMGDAAILLDDGYFNCVDFTTPTSTVIEPTSAIIESTSTDVVAISSVIQTPTETVSS